MSLQNEIEQAATDKLCVVMLECIATYDCTIDEIDALVEKAVSILEPAAGEQMQFGEVLRLTKVLAEKQFKQKQLRKQCSN